MQHFQAVISTSHPPTDDDFLSLFPACVTEDDNLRLIQVPSEEEEVKAMVFQIKPWIAPGPDGFQEGFYRNFWPNVGTAVTQMVQSFFTSGYLLKQLNDTFQVLIPKTETAYGFRLPTH